MKKADGKKMKKEDEIRLEEEKARLLVFFEADRKIYKFEPIDSEGTFFRFFSQEALSKWNQMDDDFEKFRLFLFILLQENHIIALVSEKEFELLSFFLSYVKDFYTELRQSDDIICFIVNYYINLAFVNLEGSLKKRLAEESTKTFEDLYGASPLDYVPMNVKEISSEFIDNYNYKIPFKKCPFAGPDQKLDLFDLTQVQQHKTIFIEFLEKYTIKFNFQTEDSLSTAEYNLLDKFRYLFSFYLEFDQEEEIFSEVKIVERPMSHSKGKLKVRNLFPLQSLANYQNKKDEPLKTNIEVIIDEPVDDVGEDEWMGLDEETVNIIKMKLEESRDHLQQEYDAKILALSTVKKPRK
jgi:hypothetical protein